MLEFLNDVPFGDAVVATHHALQVIRQWSLVAPQDDYYATQGAGLTELQLKLVERIICEVESQAECSIRGLTAGQRTFYVEMIARFLMELSRRKLHLESKRGKSLLARLRLAATA